MKRENWIETIFKEYQLRKFPKDNKPETQDALQILQIITIKVIHKHTIVKLLKTKEKDKTLNIAKGNKLTSKKKQ